MTAAQVSPRPAGKRRNRRFEKLLFTGVVYYFRCLFFLLSRFSKESAADLAVRLFSTPRRLKTRFNASVPPPQKILVDTPVGKVVAFRFRSAELRPPRVVVLHGWSGCAGQLQSMISKLVESGCEIVTFDQPGHGETDGTLLSLPTFVLVLRRIVAELGPFDAAVGHSLGGIAAAYVLSRDSSVFSKIVLISAPADIVDTTRRFAALFGFDEAVRALMQRKIETRYNDSMPDFAVETYGPAINAPVLILHDQQDGETPYSDAERFQAALATSKLIRTERLGHNRILRDPAVLDHIAAFVTESRALKAGSTRSAS